MSKAPWLEYRLEKLEFQNGAAITFRGARMLYNEDDHVIAIERIGATTAEIDRALDAIREARTGAYPEIKTIFYEMRVDGFPPMAFFYHPLGKGAGVYLQPRRPGDRVLFFFQRDGLPMFSKQWTLREVSRGKIPSDRAVWQFHGYRHEH